MITTLPVQHEAVGRDISEGLDHSLSLSELGGDAKSTGGGYASVDGDTNISGGASALG